MIGANTGEKMTDPAGSVKENQNQTEIRGVKVDFI